MCEESHQALTKEYINLFAFTATTKWASDRVHFSFDALEGFESLISDSMRLQSYC